MEKHLKETAEKLATESFSGKFLEKLLNEDYIIDTIIRLFYFSIKLVMAFIIYKVGKKIIDKLISSYEKTNYYKTMDKSVKSFLHSFLHLGTKIFLVIICLIFLGMKGSSLIAFVGTLGIGVGLALKDSLSNLAGGIIILTFNQYNVEDYIDVNGLSGVVKAINVFSTTINTFDNKVITIPNGSIISSPITNYSAKQVRRVEITASVGYDDNIELAKKVLYEMVESNEMVLKSPKIDVLVGEYADSSINIFVRCWCKTENFWSVHYDLLDRLKPTLDKNNISIPYPQMDIHSKG